MEYRGLQINKRNQVLDCVGNVWANCDSLEDAKETIDEIVEATKDRLETERELNAWLNSMY